MVFVEGSSFSACETWFASEFLVDPILLPAAPEGGKDGASGPSSPGIAASTAT